MIMVDHSAKLKTNNIEPLLFDIDLLSIKSRQRRSVDRRILESKLLSRNNN